MHCIVDGLMTEYIKKGSGPVVVVLHGWGTRAAMMLPVVDALADRYTVIAVDLPGFGGSQKPKEAWGVKEYADFVRAILDKLRIAEVYIMIGHSFGGRITIKAVGRGILSPRKVVLIGSAGIKHSNTIRNTAYKAVAKVGKSVLKLPGLSRLTGRARQALYAHAESGDYVTAGAMRDIFRRVIDEDLRNDAKQITVPTLLIWGEKDNQTPIEDARLFHHCIQRSQLRIIPGAGHFVYAEKPEVVANYLREFC